MTDRRIFDQLAATSRELGPTAALEMLANYLRDEGRNHELFEARKLLVRQRLGLPLIATDTEDDLPPSTREALEEGLIDACRDVGLRLLRTGRIRDAWHYLRALGDRQLVQHELAALAPREDNIDEFLELCVHEGMDLQRGFQLMLDHYGICNSITTFESSMYGRPRRDRAIGAGLLVGHLYEQLRANVAGHIQRHEGNPPDHGSLADWTAGYPWLFADGAYHIDTTHLASVVKLARDLDDPALLQRARELTQYGERLDTTLQYPGDAPFETLYPTSRRYFNALLGDDQEAHVAYFRDRAETCDPREETTVAIETYVDLLARVGARKTRLQEALRLFPEGVQQTGRAPACLSWPQRQTISHPWRHWPNNAATPSASRSVCSKPSRNRRDLRSRHGVHTQGGDTQ